MQDKVVAKGELVLSLHDLQSIACVHVKEWKWHIFILHFKFRAQLVGFGHCLKPTYSASSRIYI